MKKKIVISSDEYLPIIDFLLKEIKHRGYDIQYFGPQKDEKPLDWTEVTLKSMKEIKNGNADEGIILCWTGTGCTLIANKIPGIRAALCVDAETAKGARIWNHANVLGLSLRLISTESLPKILNSWFDTPYSTDDWNLLQMKKIKDIEQLYCEKN